LTKKVVVDSSPLIILFKSGFEEILPKLFAEIIVPDAVQREIAAGPVEDPAREKLQFSSWATFDAPRLVPPMFGLGPGESAVLAVAASTSDATVLLDDAAARRQAKALGLPVMGTGGLLVLANRASIIDSFDTALDAVVKAGLWLQPSLVELLKRKAAD